MPKLNLEGCTEANEATAAFNRVLKKYDIQLRMLIFRKLNLERCTEKNQATVIFDRILKKCCVGSNLLTFCCDVCHRPLRTLNHYPLCERCKSDK